MSYPQPYQPGGEAYRESPSQHTPNTISTASPLPSSHHYEGQHTMQSQPQQYAGMPMNGAQMQHYPPPYNPSQYQHPNGAMQPAPMPSNVGAQGTMMRFPLPPQPVTPGALSSGRHKKDIKRRTKTGCLTCRKRRIKCDEGHPSCRNCQKSKRECMGYDPIFKQQTGPAAIQPAPPSAGTQSSKSTPSSAIPPNTYHPSPQAFPGTGGTFVPASHPTQGLDPSFDYATSLDPALAGAEQSLTMAANSYSTTIQPARKVKSISVDQLFALNDIAPQYQEREAPPPTTSPRQQEIDDFYRLHFSEGLDKALETHWYGTRGVAHMHQDPQLFDFVTQCADQFKAQDAASAQGVQSLEARLVWQLITMPRSASATNGATGGADDHITGDLLPRIDVVENILTGQYLPQNRIPPSPTQAHQSHHLKYNEQNFWHHLGRFASIRDDGSNASALQEITGALSAMRGNLGMMENRDVLYSLAVARHIGGRMLEFDPRNSLVMTNDPNNDINKLEVARRFVEAEDQKGTTQIIQRLCSMAIRSWILQKQ